MKNPNLGTDSRTRSWIFTFHDNSTRDQLESVFNVDVFNGKDANIWNKKNSEVQVEVECKLHTHFIP